MITKIKIECSQKLWGVLRGDTEIANTMELLSNTDEGDYTLLTTPCKTLQQ